MWSERRAPVQGLAPAAVFAAAREALARRGPRAAVLCSRRTAFCLLHVVCGLTVRGCGQQQGEDESVVLTHHSWWQLEHGPFQVQVRDLWSAEERAHLPGAALDPVAGRRGREPGAVRRVPTLRALAPVPVSLVTHTKFCCDAQTKPSGKAAKQTRGATSERLALTARFEHQRWQSLPARHHRHSRPSSGRGGTAAGITR